MFIAPPSHKASIFARATTDKSEGRQDPSAEFTLSAVERAQNKSLGNSFNVAQSRCLGQVYKGRLVFEKLRQRNQLIG